MKKLLALCAVALMSISASAATAAWYAEDIYEYGDTGDLATGYLVYFFDASTVSTSAAAAALNASDFSFLSSGWEADYMEDGEAGTNNGVGSYGNLQDITGYFVVFNAEDTASATYAYISGTEVATTGAAGQAASFDIMGSSSATASNWTSLGSPVPEPTSGLLMLLGMAGLALRRRRA